jgi:hypothetical protein
MWEFDVSRLYVSPRPVISVALPLFTFVLHWIVSSNQWQSENVNKDEQFLIMLLEDIRTAQNRIIQ